MGDIRKNISRYEMACQCGCGSDACDTTLMDTLQITTDHFAWKYKAKGRVLLEITGPNRCVRHNERIQMEVAERKKRTYVPYSSKSQHIYSKAADFTLWLLVGGKKEMITPSEVYDFIDLEWPDKYGLGLYHNRCHVDSRANRARW